MMEKWGDLSNHRISLISFNMYKYIYICYLEMNPLIDTILNYFAIPFPKLFKILHIEKKDLAQFFLKIRLKIYLSYC